MLSFSIRRSTLWVRTLQKIHEQHQDEADKVAVTRSYGSLISAALIAIFGDTDKAYEGGAKGLAGLADIWDHREKFYRVEKNILDCFQYFKQEVELIRKEEIAMRNLKNNYESFGADWHGGHLKEDLVDKAEYEADWINLMALVSGRKKPQKSVISIRKLMLGTYKFNV